MYNAPPSEIVNYIDARLPEVKEQQEGSGRSPLIQKDRYPTVVTVLSMVDAIPEHLVTLRGSANLEYLEAVAAIRLAVKLWDTGLRQSIVDDARNGNKNPFTILRKHLGAFNDEGAEPSTSELLFIQDAKFRELLRLDLSTVNQSIDTREWKAATVLGGSVIEAFLLNALREHKKNDPSQFQSTISRFKSLNRSFSKLSGNPNKWMLHELTEIALEFSVIEDNTAAQCRIARGFRNLIHPGKAARLALECDRGTAFSVLAAIEHVIRDLA
jgi:hypothetical protein